MTEVLKETRSIDKIKPAAFCNHPPKPVGRSLHPNVNPTWSVSSITIASKLVATTRIVEKNKIYNSIFRLYRPAALYTISKNHFSILCCASFRDVVDKLYKLSHAVPIYSAPLSTFKWLSTYSWGFGSMYPDALYSISKSKCSCCDALKRTGSVVSKSNRWEGA